MSKDYEKILAPYWQKGGTYVIPTGIVNDLLGELEDLESETKHLLELQKDMDKQYEELELQNFNLKEDIMIKKMSIPNKEIKDKTFYDLYGMPTYEELKTENQHLKEKLIIKNQYDFQDIVISALRYALGRRTYITLSTVDFIKEYPEIIDERVKQVMLRDLEDYFEDRKKWEYKDDECDYQVWLSLKNWLEQREV